MFSLFSKKINVKQIQRGRHLEKAISKTVDDFMDKRMKNPIRKAFVGIYLVFFEDEDFIYWGKPVFQRIFSDKRVVDEFYKTPKAEVLEKYPEYQEDFYSQKIKEAIRKAVRHYEDLQDGVLFHHFTYRKPPFIQIEGEEFHIKVYANRNYTSAPYQRLEGEAPKAQESPRNYQIRLNRADLELLKIGTF
jgi:hypothetical protein